VPMVFAHTSRTVEGSFPDIPCLGDAPLKPRVSILILDLRKNGLNGFREQFAVMRRVSPDVFVM
jgi:hypothetical protein